MFESLVVLLSTGLISSAPEEASSLSWMDSTVETDKHATLKLASRRYARDLEDESGIWLVGVTHIGDGSFYNAVEELVQDSDLVLYESVMPRVTMTIPAGVSNEKRREVTQEAVDWLAQAIGSVSSIRTRFTYSKIFITKKGFSCKVSFFSHCRCQAQLIP